MNNFCKFLNFPEVSGQNVYQFQFLSYDFLILILQQIVYDINF